MQDKQGGFTLIELVVVIIILGVLAVTAAPKFINLQSDAYRSQLQGGIAAIKGAVNLFKAKSLVQGKETEIVEFDDIMGERLQPWAASRNGTSPSTGYTTPPEIFKAAGLSVDEWAYRIYTTDTYQVVATPKQKLDKAQPTPAEVEATQCYFHYKWETNNTPTITSVDSGC